jgi:DHA1 family tetracycline resistance protein-like MFS transporter
VREVPGAARLLLLAFLATTAFAMLEGTLALLARERFPGWTPRANGWLFSYVGLWLVVAQGWFVRRYVAAVGERRFLAAGSLCLSLAFLAIAAVRDVWLLAAVAPLSVFGFAMISPSVASLLSQGAGAGVQGEVQGVNQSVQAFARIVGPVLGNALLAVGLEVPYAAGAALMLVAFGIAWTLRARGRAPPPA